MNLCCNSRHCTRVNPTTALRLVLLLVDIDREEILSLKPSFEDLITHSMYLNNSQDLMCKMLEKNATSSTLAEEIPEYSVRGSVLVVLRLIQPGILWIVSDLQNTSDQQTVRLQELEKLLHSPVDVSEFTF